MGGTHLARIKTGYAIVALVSIIAGLICANTSQSPAACCYFSAKDQDVNQPGQKAFLVWRPERKEEAFTVQPKFEGNATDFGMVIPTPSRPKLDEMPRDFFKNLALYTILMPVPQPIYTPSDPMPPLPPECAAMGAGGGMRYKDGAVRVLESGVVGSLDYKILEATDAKPLYDWLKQNHYSYSGDEATLNHYIQKKWIFTVMKIDPKQMKKNPDGSYLGEVTPTRFTFASTACIYPLRITQISVKNKTEALFYVQAPEQMDLAGDWSWMHSYRPMYLTYMLGCSANEQQQKELTERTNWLTNKRRSDTNYQTTKLEWAKKLNTADLSVLEDPLKNYAQMGTGDLPAGSKVVSLKEFLDDVRSQYQSKGKQYTAENIKTELGYMEDQYQPSRGMIVKNELTPVKSNKNAFFPVAIQTRYTWYPARSVPQDEVKGLALLKGHLQSGQWLTKFRKYVRKDEMTDDLLLASVPKEKEQTYIRLMPTSPP